MPTDARSGAARAKEVDQRIDAAKIETARRRLEHTSMIHLMSTNPIRWRAVMRAVYVWLALSWTSAGHAEFHPAPPPAGLTGLPAYSLAFDPERDAESDLQAARVAAKANGRNVLVIVGGDWCVWCFLLDRHFSRDAEAARVWYGAFEILRVYYGEDNPNARFLSRYPDFHLFPHFFILADDGRVLGSSTADVLIKDAKYDNELLARFIRQWATQPARVE
jgi:thiol-disulfide isomerase/thioredoxin